MIYLASRKYSLKDLEVSLTVRVIQRFSDELSLPDILKETKDVFLRLLEDKDSFLIISSFCRAFGCYALIISRSSHKLDLQKGKKREMKRAPANPRTLMKDAS